MTDEGRRHKSSRKGYQSIDSLIQSTNHGAGEDSTVYWGHLFRPAYYPEGDGSQGESCEPSELAGCLVENWQRTSQKRRCKHPAQCQEALIRSRCLVQGGNALDIYESVMVLETILPRTNPTRQESLSGYYAAIRGSPTSPTWIVLISRLPNPLKFFSSPLTIGGDGLGTDRRASFATFGYLSIG
ncbi:hypothetical protein O181_017820 [Austropuccinia psidii MF-1]|uniref:Uncharacterized protein n=1 Tax=Austropuccinia psidii MF-1 TaxID=1389203 RepID=A0A9Q3GTE4_9BASI|nr:hypothetical protein [Austropuccinia psidii MF-1]